MRSFISDQLLDAEWFTWVYNIEDEQQWGKKKTIPSVSDSIQMALVSHQEQQQLFLADKEDCVVLRNKLDSQFADYLQLNGIELPEIIQSLEQAPEKAVNNTLLPYIITDDIMLTAKEYGMEKFLCKNVELIKNLNDKHFTRRLLQQFHFKVTEGFICNNVPELEEAYRNLLLKGFKRTVVKIQHGSSGKGLYLIENQEAFANYTRYLQRRGEGEQLLIEGWYDVDRNINSQLWIGDSHIELLSITEQTVDRNGIYIGTDFTPEYSEKLLAQYSEDMHRLANILFKMGYRGIAGIDSIIAADGSLFPVVEINARLTQVTYLLPLVQRFYAQYRFLESRYVRVQSKRKYTFDEIHALLKKALRSGDDLGFFIYTYSEVHANGNYHYRLFLLLQSNEKNKIKESMERLAEFQDLVQRD